MVKIESVKDFERMGVKPGDLIEITCDDENSFVRCDSMGKFNTIEELLNGPALFYHSERGLGNIDESDEEGLVAQSFDCVNYVSPLVKGELVNKFKLDNNAHNGNRYEFFMRDEKIVRGYFICPNIDVSYASSSESGLGILKGAPLGDLILVHKLYCTDSIPHMSGQGYGYGLKLDDILEVREIVFVSEKDRAESLARAWKRTAKMQSNERFRKNLIEQRRKTSRIF